MPMLRNMMMLVLGLGLSACASVDVATRNAPFEPMPSGQPLLPEGYQHQPVALPLDGVVLAAAVPAQAATAPADLAAMHVTRVSVSVPRSLSVSEANRYLPRGDIVWREDPIGDRHMQVQKIVQAAVERGAASADGPVPVVLNVRVTRFHAVTEKARYTVGGVHSIGFELALSDPATGELLTPVRKVQADLDAFGGQQALRAEAAGQTQKVRITNHLAEVIRQELSNPEGYQNPNLGFMQVLNKI